MIQDIYRIISRIPMTTYQFIGVLILAAFLVLWVFLLALHKDEIDETEEIEAMVLDWKGRRVVRTADEIREAFYSEQDFIDFMEHLLSDIDKCEIYDYLEDIDEEDQP